MGVIAATIKIGSWRGAFGKDGRVSYTLHVETDDAGDGPFVIYNSPLVPKVGSYYAVGNEASIVYRCESVKPKVDSKDKWLWDVEIEYEKTEAEEGRDGENEEDPRPSRRFRFNSLIRYEKIPLVKDLDGKLVRNTAGESYSKPIEFNRKILVINIERKEFANPFAKQTKYQNAVNSSTFWGQSPGKVLIESYLADGTAEGKLTTGWDVKYSIAIRPTNAPRWDEVEIPSMGFNEKIQDTGPAGEYLLREIINEATGKAFTVEQYLNENGRWMDRTASNFKPYMSKYRILEKYPFAPLRLPDMTSLIYSAQLESDAQ